MDAIVKEAIEEGFADYQDSDMWNMSTNERDVYTLGWKEGYEWILSELIIDKKITIEDLQHYMNKIED